jgi:hypothetical protein
MQRFILCGLVIPVPIRYGDHPLPKEPQNARTLGNNSASQMAVQILSHVFVVLLQFFPMTQ